MNGTEQRSSMAAENDFLRE